MLADSECRCVCGDMCCHYVARDHGMCFRDNVAEPCDKAVEQQDELEPELEEEATWAATSEISSDEESVSYIHKTCGCV